MKALETNSSTVVLGQHFSRANNPARKKRLQPFSIRFTPEERAYLLGMAGGQSLASYIRSCVLDEPAAPRRDKASGGQAAPKQIARLLSALGHSRLSQNMNQIAKAANMGTLDVSPELETELHLACREITQMRAALLSALRTRPVRLS